MSQVIPITPTPQMLTTSTLTAASSQQPSMMITSNAVGTNERGHDIILRASTIFNNVKIETSSSLDLKNVHNQTETEMHLGSGEGSLEFIEPPKIRLMPTIKLLATPHATDPKRKFVCPYDNCTKSYGKSSHLRSHLTWHTGIKPFVCNEPKCGKGFTRSDELNRHSRTHTGEKPFECVQCSKKFSRSDHLTKHLATHDRQIKNSISKCSIVNSKLSIKKISKLERKRDSQLNEKSYLDFDKGLHFMAVLGEESTNATDEQTLENIQHNPVRIKFEKPGHSNKYQCVQPLPDTQLPLMSGLKTKPEVKYEPVDDIVDSHSELSQVIGNYREPHLVQDRPFCCVECEKRFKRQDDLNRHIRTHTGEKPYACPQCCRRFVRSDHLKKHQQTHLKLR